MIGFGHHPSGRHETAGVPCARSRSVVPLLVCLASFSAAFSSATAEEKSAAARPMTVIEAGTVVDATDRDRWNRVVLLATPRFASGDTEDVSESIKDAVGKFTFAILATVRRRDTPRDDDDGPRHELVEVGVGYCMPVNDRLTVIAPNASVAGFSLDFLGRQVLSAKHKSLAEIGCVGRHDTAVVFDAPMLMLRGDDHEDLVVRHLVRLDQRSGNCSTCAWLVTTTQEGDLKPIEEPLRLIDGGTREERPIHVDGRRFTFGLPTKQAFAVEDLPPGRRVDWSTALRAAAAAPVYTDAALDRLVAELDTAVTSLRTLRSAER